MSTRDADIGGAVIEAQALLTLVADKLAGDALSTPDILTLHVAVQVALARLDVVHDLLQSATAVVTGGPHAQGAMP